MANYDGLANVSRETSDALGHYQNLILKWNPSINLIAKSTLADLQNRHIEDSAQLFQLFPKKTMRVADLGSGGGLPGIVLAILSREYDPDTLIYLVESDARKAAFLRTVSIELDLKVEVLNERIETLSPISADVVVARALAPLSKLMSHLQRHVKTDGISLIPKGRKYKEELVSASDKWNYRVSETQSVVDGESVILTISNLQEKEDSGE
jgi:16S rRNA (guanine527-N7)-methyltransferase